MIVDGMKSAVASLPHILYLHSHDTGRYIQPYGYPVPTPHLQRFAEQGVLFRHAFCAGPTCSPSRAALMTGQAPHTVGMFGLAQRGMWRLHDYSHTLPRLLRSVGYHAVLGGFQHITDWTDDAWQMIGYDRALPFPKGQVQIDEVAAFLRHDHTQPFFLDVGFTATHRTRAPGDAVQWHNGKHCPLGDPRYTRPPVTLPDNPVTRADFADYAVAARDLDQHYGRILQVLDDTGLARNTVVIVTTDHGIAFPRMKCNLTDHGIGVLLMMRGPDELGLRGGKVIDAMVSHLDLLPTLGQWTGATAPPDIHGRSLVPLLDGSVDVAAPDALHDAIFAEVTYHGRSYEPERAIRTPRHKYIRRFDQTPITRHACCDSVSKNLMIGQGWGKTAMPEEQLYDLALDPTESNNLADRGGHGDVIRSLHSRLEAWMAQTGDPLLHGPVREPAPVAVQPA